MLRGRMAKKDKKQNSARKLVNIPKKTEIFDKLPTCSELYRIIQPTPPEKSSLPLLMATFQDIVLNKLNHCYTKGYLDKWKLKTDRKSFLFNFEKIITQYLKINRNKFSVYGVSSGTNALRLAFIALGLKPDSKRCEIIVPALTEVASIEAIISMGFKPILVDVNVLTWNVDIKEIENQIKKETIGILSVDYCGNPTDYFLLRRLADKYNLKWISDSAQSFGSTYFNKTAPHYADAVIYSFGYPKNITSLGKGGALVIRKEFNRNIEKDSCGLLRHETLPEINALFGLEQIVRYRKILQNRVKAVMFLIKGLSKIPGLCFQKITSGAKSNYYRCPILINSDKFGWNISEIITILRAQNIEVHSNYLKPIYDDDRLYFLKAREYKNTENISRNALDLPINSDMTLQSAKKIIEAFTSLFIKRKNKEKIYNSYLTSFNSYSQKAADLAEILAKHSPLPLININEGGTFCYFVKNKLKRANNILIPADIIRFMYISSSEINFILESIKTSLFKGKLLHRDLYIKHILPSGDIVISSKSFEKKYLVNKVVPHFINSKWKEVLSVFSTGGSPAKCALILDKQGKLLLAKYTNVEGVDSNGRLWLSNQAQHIFRHKRYFKGEYGKFLPRIINSFKGGKWVGYLMEYIESETLSDLISMGLPIYKFRQYYKKILSVLCKTIYRKHKKLPVSANYCGRIFIDRMERRMNWFIKNVSGMDSLKKLINRKQLIINGIKYIGLGEIIKLIKKSNFLVDVKPKYSVVHHGDLILDNILITPREQIVFFDMRGLNLENYSKKVQYGDIAYDLGKTLFSICGYSLIRSGSYDAKIITKNKKVLIEFNWPLTDPRLYNYCRVLRETIKVINNHKGLKKYLKKDKYLKYRALFSVGANFISDSPMSIYRGGEKEFIALFTLGIIYLNNFLKEIRILPKTFQNKFKDKKVQLKNILIKESPLVGIDKIFKNLVLAQRDSQNFWSMIEIMTRKEGVDHLKIILEKIKGEIIPKNSIILFSNEPVGEDVIKKYKREKNTLILVNVFSEKIEQLNAITATMEHTNKICEILDLSQSTRNELKILSILSTGESSRCQLFVRRTDKLLMSIIPKGTVLEQIILQSLQLFQRNLSGRWIVQNDDIYLFSRIQKFDKNHI